MKTQLPSSSIVDFDSTVKFLYSISTFGIKLGLDTIRTITSALGNPQNDFKIVVVAGTNGKGSVCSMLSQVLQNSGYKTGLYTSPHLVHVRERVRIDDKMISEKDFISIVKEIAGHADRLFESGKLEQYPTYFEFITAVAFQWYKENKVDIAVMEIGLGGRFDAVNIVEPEISIITDIDLDHRKWLGDTLSKIAYEKAGVMRKNRITVTSVSKNNAFMELKKNAAEKRAIIHNALQEVTRTIDTVGVDKLERSKKNRLNNVRLRFEKKFTRMSFKTAENEYNGLIPALPGEHQARNISAVIRASEILREKGYKISKIAIIDAIELTNWQGRLEWFAWKVPVLFDGAHNPAGMRTLVKYFRDSLDGQKFDLLFIVKRKKNYIEIIKLLFPHANRIYMIRHDKKGFIPVEKIQQRAGEAASKITIYDSFDEFNERYKLSKDSAFLLCTGSLHLIGDFKGYINSSDQKPDTQKLAQ
ncbi:MAG: bifunctional folylpolyglutamate synthase/dihydrofolate synthase [Acidobacteria bacterium]|nr:bifunctional folylpolyglutamate synthase/dihydrofolate synthase [Acidobacteriota bacterium]